MQRSRLYGGRDKRLKVAVGQRMFSPGRFFIFRLGDFCSCSSEVGNPQNGRVEAFRNMFVFGGGGTT
ncbi:hypothetical protein [Paenibacillus elgii]|uniref:hypothetical protein n=1 Tax=Paenibacillus elgii TaxID=189691 RepID=UPI0013D81DED|nr:hypothetical protein [Paenibacillus elgii]